MPPYAPRPLTIAARSSSSLRRLVVLAGCRRVRRCHLGYRTASTLTVSNNSNGRRDTLVAQNEVENGLRRARSVLTSASRLRGKAVSAPESVLEPLVEACDALSTTEARSDIRVSIYSEEETPSRDLTTILLDEPLSSDESLRSTVRERWSMREDASKAVLRFQQAGPEVPDKSVIALSSPFFARFSHPVTLEELLPSSSASTVVSRLLEADIPVFVASPLHSPSPSLLFAISQNPHALLVIDSALDSTSPSADRLRTQIASKYNCDPERVLLVDTTRALRGSSSLSADPSSASAVRAFQEDMLASGVPSLLRVLTENVALGPSRLRPDTESALTKRAINAVKDTIHHAKEEAGDVRVRSSALQEEALEAQERAEVEILGGDPEVVVQGEQDRIAKGVERVAADLKPTLDGMTWWRLPFVVDDVSVRVDGAVEQALAKEFENELVFHTGRLAFLQTHFVIRTKSLLSSLPPAFQSPVLQNHLAQITSAPSFLITHTSSSPSSPFANPSSNSLPPPPALLTPLRIRTAQLTYATRALHLTAQRLLLFTYSHTTLSTLASALLYVHTTLDGSTSVGIGVLSALAGLRWAVGRWARAKGKWWNSFGRVGEGLGRDMSAVLRSVLERQVCIVPNEACVGLQRILEKSKEEIEGVEDEVEGLEASIVHSRETEKEEVVEKRSKG